MKEKSPLLPDVLISGTPIRLLALATTRSRWTSSLIGAKAGRYIIVEMPKAGGAPIKLDDGTRWAVNFISQGAVYNFESEVIGYTYRLVPLLFLSYPSEVSIANLRTAKRYPVNIQTITKVLSPPPKREEDELQDETENEIKTPEGDLKTLVVDLSENGFMMICPDKLPLESTVSSDFYLPTGDSINGIQSIVKTCHGKPGSYLTGLSLALSNSPETLEEIKKLIASIEKIPLRL